jgi:hypothetical protein
MSDEPKRATSNLTPRPKTRFKIWRNEFAELTKGMRPGTKKYKDTLGVFWTDYWLHNPMELELPTDGIGIANADPDSGIISIYLDLVLNCLKREYELNPQHITETAEIFVTHLTIHELIHLLGDPEEEQVEILTKKMTGARIDKITLSKRQTAPQAEAHT